MSSSEENLRDHVRKTYPQWGPESVNSAVASGILIFSGAHAEVEGVVQSVPAVEVVQTYSSNDGVLFCKCCAQRLSACACTCGVRCRVSSCGFVSFSEGLTPLATVIGMLRQDSVGALSVFDLKTPLTTDGTVLVDGHHRLAGCLQTLQSVNHIERPGQASEQLRWNHALVRSRPRCARAKE